MFWTFDDGTLTISGAGEMDACQNFCEVVAESIERVVVEDGAISVGSFAFSFCADLASVTLPESLREISVGAFNFCESLAEIKIPANVTRIGKAAFCGCWSLEEIFLPASLVEIGENAFINCSNLRTAEISAGVQKIGSGAFKGCENLTEIKIPASVVKIGDEVFAGCEALKKIFCADSVFVENLRGGNNAEIVLSNDAAENFSWEVDGDTLKVFGAGAAEKIFCDENAPWFDKRESIKKIFIGS